MSDEKSFLTLVHHIGKIKKNSRNTILQKLGVSGSKRVEKLFYRAPVAVIYEHVKYGSFVVQSDADFDVIFHCWRNLLEVRTTELYAKLEDVVASSGESKRLLKALHYPCRHAMVMPDILAEFGLPPASVPNRIK
ncbi:hypothetical protein PIB30_094502 [Stylosanthes scabra]|uniref:Uncharacterized protein n=1 Tax=Stylosanthes scabra TaxID=79078 RepID=A0ABU6XV44_9FABA|nr:hypothetical protein [Stylosanthes scabra]